MAGWAGSVTGNRRGDRARSHFAIAVFLALWFAPTDAAWPWANPKDHTVSPGREERNQTTQRAGHGRTDTPSDALSDVTVNVPATCPSVSRRVEVCGSILPNLMPFPLMFTHSPPLPGLPFVATFPFLSFLPIFRICITYSPSTNLLNCSEFLIAGPFGLSTSFHSFIDSS
jgi:hypothetical protein